MTRFTDSPYERMMTRRPEDGNDYSSLVPFCKQISCSHENLLTKRHGGSAAL